MRLNLKKQSEHGMFCPGWQKWYVMFRVAKMAWDVMSRVTKTAWDVLSGLANLCGMFCPGCKKWHGMFCPGMFCPAFSKTVSRSVGSYKGSQFPSI